jgi:hypothetical protein
MSSPDPDARVHRILAGCAVLHAFLISSWFVASWPVFPWNSEWQGDPFAADLWIAMATLWLFWLIVLVLHRGRSIQRILISSTVSLVILWPAWREYSAIAPQKFGVPEDVHSFSLREIWEYYSAYRAGKKEAETDVALGHLTREEIGMPKPEGYYRTLKKRYQIEPRRMGDIVTTGMMGHARGYNDVSDPAIKRKFSSDVIGAATDEAWKQEAQAKQNP